MTGQSLSELRSIDWASLSDAYGSAEDVPAQLQAIAQGDDEAYEDAFGNLWHQGTIYSATPHAIPFLIGILAAGTRNADLLHLLGCMARGEGEAKAEVTAALLRGIPVFLPFLYSQEAEEVQLGAYLLGGLLNDDARVRPALLDGFYAQQEAGGQLAFIYQLRNTKLDAAMLGQLHTLMTAEADSDEAHGLQLAGALALAFNEYQPAFKSISEVLKAALTGWDAEQFFSDALFDPDDIFDDITRVAKNIGQAEEFAQVFWQKTQDAQDINFALYALDLAHPARDAPFTPLAREILGFVASKPHGFAHYLSEVHGLPPRREELRNWLEENT